MQVSTAALRSNTRECGRPSGEGNAFAEYFTDFTPQIKQLSEQLREHQNLFSRKTVNVDGSLGEQFVVQQLRQAFEQDGDTFRVWSDVGHKGDAVGEIRLSELEPPLKVLIEVKNYAKAVPSEEFDKFCRDLRENPDVKAGLFVSLRSTVHGKRKFVTTEVIEGRLAVCVVQEYPEQYLFVAAWAMLRSLLSKGTASLGSQSLADLAQRATRRVLMEVSIFLDDIKRDVGRVATIRRAAEGARKNVEQIVNESTSLEVEILSRASALGRILDDERTSLETGPRPRTHVPRWTTDEWQRGFESIGIDWEVHKANLSVLLRYLQSADDLSGEWLEDGKGTFVVKVRAVERFRITATKTALRILIPEPIVTSRGLVAPWEKGRVGHLLFKATKACNLDLDVILSTLETDTDEVEMA